MAVRLNDPGTKTVDVCVGPHVLQLSQDPTSGAHGSVVWDAGMALAAYFAHHPSTFSPDKLAGKKAIELGSGTGVAGMALALCGADVTLTDLPSITPLLEANVARNASVLKDAPDAGAVCVRALTWGEDDPAAFDGPYDVIIATDVIFSETLAPVLLDTIAGLASPATRVHLVNEFRCELITDVFLHHAAETFRLKRVPRKRLPPTFADEGLNMRFYDMRLKPGSDVRRRK